MFKKTDESEFGQQAPRPNEFVCAGEDLKDMLAQLSRQFIDADQRNSMALHEMRGRLENLGRSAEFARDHAPAEYAPAFARIEDGVQNLADRIAAVGREREITKATAAMMHVEPAVEAPSFAAVASQPAAAVVNVEPNHSVAGDAAEPWDRQSAEALARLYESGEATLASSETAPVAAAAPAPVAPALFEPALSFVAPDIMAAPPAAPTHEPAPHADRLWLEERFAEIATRVEQSMAEMRPDNALVAFDDRLVQLEQRFSSALDDVATRADVEGLRIVEAHINELAGQFEQAHGQLGRIEHIERQLGDLMHQVSDERFTELFSSVAPAAHHGPSEDDIEAVAMAVADRVASRMPQPQAMAASADAGSIGDLKRLVEGFVAGQRETEEHTSAMLDTMQQAMIRMLDRMDAIENAPPSYGASQANFAGPTPAPMTTAPVAIPTPAAAPAAVAASRHEPTFDAEPEAATPPAPSLATGHAAPQTKEDFRAAAIADARRAARKVATQTTEATLGPAEGGRVRRGAPAVEVHVPEVEAAPAKRQVRTPLLVAGIALVVAIGLLAASVGFNRGGSGGERQMAQQKSSLTVDNGSVETTSGELPDSGQKTGTPTPSIEANSTDPRPAPAAAAPRPGAAPAVPGNKAGGVQGLSEQLETTGETQIVPQDAALRSPGVAPTRNPLGMAVTPTSAVTDNSDLARMRRERNMASLANQLAAVQANAPTLPASMMHAADGAAPTDAATPSEMPPAQIGPISLRTAAQKGDPSAEFEVAARFAEGRGVAQDFKQANAWYSRAAQRGFAPAQYRLGTLFERGIGTKADVARAKVWYGRAAEQGHVKAMHNLAVLNSGREQSADYAMAVHWFTAAAERGLADSQYNLGVLYESGLGMPRDLKQAYHWLSLAARNGDKEAARRRDAIRMKLEEGEVAAADAIVENWRAQASDPVVNEARAAGEMWKQRQAAAR